MTIPQSLHLRPRGVALCLVDERNAIKAIVRTDNFKRADDARQFAILLCRAWNERREP